MGRGYIMKKKNEVSIIRSSAAEYLTFITATGESDVNAVYFDENVWLTQKMMGLLYSVKTLTINYHIKKYLRMMNWRNRQVFENFEYLPQMEKAITLITII